MPEIKNNFIKGKMNKDLDERLIQKGEYREAQNIALSESADSDSGALETILGNVQKNITSDFKEADGTVMFSSGTAPETIGIAPDLKNKRIIYFITNFTGDASEANIRSMTRASGAGSTYSNGTAYNGSSTDDCCIAMYDIETSSTRVLAYGSWLNFSLNHPITGVQVMDDLLFWTDDYNPPRKINIAKAKIWSDYYTCEEQISLAKYAPYAPIRLLNRIGYWADSNTATADVATDKTTSSIKSEYMKDKFIRFSYRYRYEDGEYSTMAPFTQIVFEPLNGATISNTEDAKNVTANEPAVDVSKHSVYKKTTVDIMQNAINKVILRIPMPNLEERNASADYSSGAYSNDYKIDAIEVLIKESDGLAIRSVKTIKLSEMGDSDYDYYEVKSSSSGSTYDRQVLKYVYRSEQPYKVLPEDQLVRVYDQVPLRAKALEIVSNRVVLANYLENYDYPKDLAGRRGIDYNVGVDDKGDAEFGQTHGLIQKTFRAYKYHSIKQRRSYQVGIVFADKYGRQSPVILSSATTDDADTVTTDPRTGTLYNNTVTTAVGSTSGSNTVVTLTQANENIAIGQTVTGTGIIGSVTVANISGTTLTLSSAMTVPSSTTLTFLGYTWAAGNQIAYGEALKISFNDTQLFNDNANIYNGTFNAGFNPYGWYSYKIVVKQPEQDYYNIYCSHPFDGWDNIEGVGNTGRDAGKSFLSLYGDNINKVPRSLNDTDLNRKGVQGSEMTLYPKVVFSTAGESVQNNQLQEPAEVISLGDAFEQNLYVSGDDNASGTGGFSIFNWVYSKDRNPLIAELPNMKKYLDAGAVGNGNCLVNGGAVTFTPLYVKADVTDGKDFVVTDQIDGTGDVGIINVANNALNASNLKVSGSSKTVTVTAYNNSTDTMTLSSLQTLKKGDYLLFSNYFEGLSVYETEPFDSKIDIYYETSTCGLVEDLNEELSDNTDVVNSPAIGSLSATTFPESQAENTVIAELSATDNSTAGNLSYDIVEVTDGNGADVGDRFSIAAKSGDNSKGELKLTGAFRRKDTNADALTFQFEVNDPNTQAVYSTQNQHQMTVVNSVPTFSNSSATASVTYNAGYYVTFFQDSVCTNGSAFSNENHYGANNLGMTVSHTMPMGVTQAYWFTVGIVNNTLTVKTSGQWNTTNAQTFFQQSAANRTMTITLDDGMATDNTASMTLLINEGNAAESGYLTVSGSACTPCEESQATFYANINTGTTVPFVESGELRIFEGNKVYTDSNLSTTASAGHYLYQTTSVAPGFWCAELDSNGVVVDLEETDECDDRES